MLKKIGLGALALSLWHISASSAISSDQTSVLIQESCVVGEKVELEISTNTELPSSSFYRISIDCPTKPSGAEISAETGYPVTDIIFSAPGDYECEVEIGFVTKSSCAGAQYTPITKKTFKITAAPADASARK
ncbi:MAG: hypothetical protein HDQ93_07080 [Desulfovibrio sp.]|nr:hypothetical protein [Desulfovibrio sp.]